MTDEVARLVLRNNYQQTQAISFAQQRGLEDLGFQQRLMQTLEPRGLLDRAVECLPDDVELAEHRRRGEPLRGPSWRCCSPTRSFRSIRICSNLPFRTTLTRARACALLPAGGHAPLPRGSGNASPAPRDHRALANSMINRDGPMLVVRIADQTGASADRIAAAFVVVRDSYDMTAVNTAIEGGGRTRSEQLRSTHPF